MKKYYLFCNGSRGDCEPAICLAQYMLQQGDDVCIYSNNKNKKLLEKSGIRHEIILKNYIERQPEEVSPLEYFNEFKDNVDYQLDIINNIKEKPNAVFGMGDQLGKFLAEKFKVPYYHIVLQYYQVPHYAKNQSYLEIAEENLEKLYRKTVGYWKLANFNKLRVENGLEEISDFIDYIYNNDNVIVANSLILSNFNYIKHDKIFVSGNINQLIPLDPSIDEVEGLSDFLDNDTDYIYLNLGSMSQHLNEKLFNLYKEAFKNINCKVIIGCNRKEQSEDPKFFFCSSINQHELFKKMNVVIHCGGLGVAFKAAFHGVPQIIIPKNFEEPFWAQKVVELGSGDAISDFKYLTNKNLREKVTNVLNNKKISYNASIVAKSIDINGVVNIYNQFLK